MKKFPQGNFTLSNEKSPQQGTLHYQGLRRLAIPTLLGNSVPTFIQNMNRTQIFLHTHHHPPFCAVFVNRPIIDFVRKSILLIDF